MMKKIFKNWRQLLNEAKEQPGERHPNNADIAKKHREARKAAAAARAAKKYGTGQDVPGDAMTPADPKKFTPSGKMARRINTKKSRRGDGLGVTKPDPTTEGADSTAFDEWLGDLNITRPQFNKLYAKRTVDQPADLVAISFNKDGSIDAEWEDERGRIEVTTLEARRRSDSERDE